MDLIKKALKGGFDFKNVISQPHSAGGKSNLIDVSLLEVLVDLKTGVVSTSKIA